MRWWAGGRGPGRPVKLPRLRPALAASALWILAAAAGPSAALESDRIQWIPSNGGTGWSAHISAGPRPEATASSSLTAPTWFPKLPDAKLQLTNSGTLDLASLRGRVTVIDFWASWCGPCLQELPHLQKLHLTKPPASFAAVAINVDEDAATAAASAKRLGLTMPIAINDAAFYREVGARSLPTLLVVDREGRIRGRWNGYRRGWEVEIAAKVDEVLAGDANGLNHPVAKVITGAGKLRGLWARDLPGNVEGLVAMPPGAPNGARAWVSAANMLIPLTADGETMAAAASTMVAGKLLDFGLNAEGSREIAAYRPGGTSIGIFSIMSGTERRVSLAQAISDAAVGTQATGDRRHLAVLTAGGVSVSGGMGSGSRPLDGTASVRAVAGSPGRGVLALRDDGAITFLDAGGAAWPNKAEGAERILAALDEGVFAGPRTAIAAVVGRFLPGDGRQLAVGTYAGHLALLDVASGKVLFDAVWPDLHDLAATDLDGDGLDDLIVGAGRSVVALGAAPPGKRPPAKR